MQKIIDQITDQLIGLIKKDQEYYTPEHMLKAGIPSYIVERVRLVISRKVLEDVDKPISKWLISDNEILNQAWKDFRSAVISSTAVPHDELQSILHRIVSDILSIFVEPRKNMARYLFREDKVLSFKEVFHRCEYLTIYKHFGTAIPLYMHKKNLEELSIERCHQLIKNLDARIVAEYTAEDWAKKLDLLFTLFGGKIDTDLLILFFRDKGLENAASIFEQIDEPITKSTFTQMLSENKLDINAVSETQVKAIEYEKETDEKDEDLQAEEVSIVGDKEESENKNLASVYQEEDSEDDVKGIMGDITEKGAIESDNTEQAASLNSLFGGNIEESVTGNEIDPEDLERFKANLTSILDQAKDSFDGVISGSNAADEDELIIEDEFVEDPVEESIEEEKEIESDSEEIKEEEDSTEEKEDDQPMWAQFLSPEQMDVMMGTREQEKEESSLNEALNIEDDFGDSILEEIPKDEESKTDFDTAKVKALEDILSHNRKTWIKKIFKGKKKAYNEAIEEISYFKSWEDASLFVQTDVFGEYKVDMLSEEAIAFIDALQTYFNEYKS